jgi:FkbM family methyltransferase
MGLKFLVGSTLSKARERMLASSHFPLTRYYPYGVSWLYDLMRIKGTRSLGTVFDVGANRGQTVEALLKFAPDAAIHSFEPGSKVFEELRRAYGDRRNVQLHQMALGSKKEQRSMLIREESELNTLVSSGVGTEASRTETIEISTVDEIVALNNISHLDLLKIDVQGWEMEVLKGAANLIANQNLMFVFAETAFSARETEMQQFGDLHGCLEQNGFTLCGFYELMRYGPRKEFVLFCNALYVSPAARLKWTDIGPEWDRWMAQQTPTRT